MNLINLVIFLVLGGLVVWLFETQIPLPSWAKTVVRVFLVLITIVWILNLMGYSGPSFLKLH